MRDSKSAFAVLILLFSTGEVCAQYVSTSFESLFFPRSIVSAGMGEQGAASRYAIDAMSYNPANLIYSDGLELSFFNNPWEILSASFGFRSPLHSFAGTMQLGRYGYAGLEYTDRDFGYITVMDPSKPDGWGPSFHECQRTFAAGYALPLSEEFAIGAQLRYIWWPFGIDLTIHHLLFGAGLAWKPGFLDDRLSLGLSFMNLSDRVQFGSYTDTVNGQRVTHSSYDSPPSEINIGLEGLVVSNSAFDISASVGAMKILGRGGPPDYEAQSSFRALLNNWKDFPDDMTAQFGVGYVWHPIRIGGGLSFFQEMYQGFFTIGPKESYAGFYTHGVDIGLEYRGVRLSAGYSGRWHNNNAGNYITFDFPWEVFQFSLSVRDGIFSLPSSEKTSEKYLRRIIISGGFGYGVYVGRMKGETVQGSTGGPYPSSWIYTDSWSPRPDLSAGADFYLKDDLALTTSFSYTRIGRTMTLVSPYPDGIPQPFDLSMETLSVTSGLRYHPLEIFSPLFVEGDVGITRLNPIRRTSPRYTYQSFVDLAAGVLLEVPETPVVVLPSVKFRTMFMDAGSDGSRVGGYNQFEFGINVGYSFEM